MLHSMPNFIFFLMVYLLENSINQKQGARHSKMSKVCCRYNSLPYLLSTNSTDQSVKWVGGFDWRSTLRYHIVTLTHVMVLTQTSSRADTKRNERKIMTLSNSFWIEVVGIPNQRVWIYIWIGVYPKYRHNNAISSQYNRTICRNLRRHVIVNCTRPSLSGSIKF